VWVSLIWLLIIIYPPWKYIADISIWDLVKKTTDLLYWPVRVCKPAPQVDRNEPIRMTHGLGQDMTATVKPPPMLSPNLQVTRHTHWNTVVCTTRRNIPTLFNISVTLQTLYTFKFRASAKDQRFLWQLILQ